MQQAALAGSKVRWEVGWRTHVWQSKSRPHTLLIAAGHAGCLLRRADVYASRALGVFIGCDPVRDASPGPRQPRQPRPAPPLLAPPSTRCPAAQFAGGSPS